MPRVAVGSVLVACVAAGCSWSEEEVAGQSRASDYSGVASRKVGSTYAKRGAPIEEEEAPGKQESDRSTQEVSEMDFDRVVLMSGKPVLVNFRAAWCGNCRKLDPTVDELARENEGRMFVVKVDYDRCPTLVDRYQVRKLPALLMFVDGALVEETRGVKPREELDAMVASHLNPTPNSANSTPVVLERTAELPPAPPMPTADATPIIAAPIPGK